MVLGSKRLKRLASLAKTVAITHVDALSEDLRAVFRNDPAAGSIPEVLATYPGVHALVLHRIAHGMWKQGQRFPARCVSHASRFLTGVEIHPGAKLGRGIFIDHGMGVVIGETARVGDGCVLFKGVVLGGTRTDRCLRHPQIGDNVVIGTNACVLGYIEVGDEARIGSGSVVVHPVPAGSTVVGVPGRIVPRNGDKRARFHASLDHANLPDPIQVMLRSLRDENDRLEKRLVALEAKLGVEATSHGDEDRHLIDAELATSDLPPQHGG